MPLKKIFFSYSRQDGSEFSLRLATDLKKHGFNVWIDQQDIRAGMEWDLEIEKALETCDCLLFVETEKSVVSNNVLDEVYYALEQKKKVIPLIVKDSKTPFRIQRIQHIDFTTNYDAGLKKIIQELQSTVANTFVETSQVITPRKTFVRQYAGWLLTALAIIVVVLGVLWYNASNNAMLVEDTKNTGEEEQVAAAEKVQPGATVAITDTETVRSGKKPEPSSTEKTNSPIADHKKDKPSVKKTAINFSGVEGDWKLESMDFKVRSFDGYLKISAATDNKLTVKSMLRFFYVQPKDTTYLSIFNAFVGCSNCEVQEEVNLTVEDIAIGSQVYSILKHDQEGVGKAGDTVMDRGANKSIRGTAVLQFTDNKTAVIKVSRSTPVTLEGGLILNPFTYLFTFKKME